MLSADGLMRIGVWPSVYLCLVMWPLLFSAISVSRWVLVPLDLGRGPGKAPLTADTNPLLLQNAAPAKVWHVLSAKMKSLTPCKVGGCWCVVSHGTNWQRAWQGVKGAACKRPFSGMCMHRVARGSAVSTECKSIQSVVCKRLVTQWPGAICGPLPVDRTPRSVFTSRT